MINGSAEGWTIYYTEQTFMVTLVSGTKQYSMTISELAKVRETLFVPGFISALVFSTPFISSHTRSRNVAL